MHANASIVQETTKTKEAHWEGRWSGRRTIDEMQTGSHRNHQTTPTIGTAIAGPIRRAMRRWRSKGLAFPPHHPLDWWSFSMENERADAEHPVNKANRGNPPIDVLEGRTQRYTSSPDHQLPPSPAHGASQTRPNPEDSPPTAGGRYCCRIRGGITTGPVIYVMAGRPGMALALGRRQFGRTMARLAPSLPQTDGHLSQ